MRARLDLPEPHARALKVLLGRIPPEEIPWALTGSAGLRLQGVDLPVHDLDLQSDAQSIYRIEERLAEFIKTPAHPWESPHMRSLDGKAEIEAVEVELLADIAHRMPDGSWSGFTDSTRRIWLDWRGLRVPVFPLEDEAAAYESMGRTEKATLIRETIVRLTMETTEPTETH